MSALPDPPILPPWAAEPEPDADRNLNAVIDLAEAWDGDVAEDGRSLALGPVLWEPYVEDHPEARPALTWAQRWRIIDDGAAEWALAKYAAADQQLAALREQAQDWHDRIDAWFDHGTRRPLATAAFMGAHLERYALERREQDPKAKTLVLPSGAVKTIVQKPKAAVDDEAAVVAWADATLGLDAEDVAPHAPRKVYVNPLRDHVTIVEVVDHAQLTLANSAEIVEWGTREMIASGRREYGSRIVVADGRCPQTGDGWPSPEDAADIVARVDVLSSHSEVYGPDGKPVPGAVVEPGRVTAKVIPS